MELIPGLPEEIGLECLTRLHYSTHRVASLVCKQWNHLLQSSEFYNERKRSGFTRKLACFVQSLSVPVNTITKPLSSSQPSFGITIFDPKTQSWERLNPIPKYSSTGIPFFSQLTSVVGKLVIMGGWNPVSWDPVQDVFVYDFTTQKWRQGKDMPSKRSLFASAGFNGKIFVSGGHDENKNALKSGWAYDVKEDEWNELTQMIETRDECQGIVIGNEFCVVSGYGTDEQGKFKGSAEFYNLETKQWRRVDGVWIEGKSPRGSVSVNKDGKNLVCLSQVEDSVVSVGVCGVDLGELTLLTGSAYQGATPGFYSLHVQGESSKLQKVEVQNDFCGFVQSGCCVEV